MLFYMSWGHAVFKLPFTYLPKILEMVFSFSSKIRKKNASLHSYLGNKFIHSIEMTTCSCSIRRSSSRRTTTWTASTTERSWPPRSLHTNSPTLARSSTAGSRPNSRRRMPITQRASCWVLNEELCWSHWDWTCLESIHEMRIFSQLKGPCLLWWQKEFLPSNYSEFLTFEISNPKKKLLKFWFQRTCTFFRECERVLPTAWRWNLRLHRVTHSLQNRSRLAFHSWKGGFRVFSS